MTDFLTHLGALSLGGAAAILVLAGTSLFTRSRYAARWRCWAWLLLCLRLAIPFPLPDLSPQAAIQPPIHLPAPPNQVIITPNTPASQPPTTPQPGESTGTTAPTAPTTPTVPAPGQSGQNVQTPSAPGASSGLTLTHLLLAVWLGVAALILVWSLWGHLRFKRYLRRWSAPVSNPEVLELYEQTGKLLGLRRLPQLVACQGLEVPMLAGVLRPVLLLPRETMAYKPLCYSLIHELTHYRRRDILLKTLVLWVAALHWFNPAAWLMVRAVERDTELGCDDAALRLLPPEDHAAYGQTILTAVERLKGERK